MPKGCMPCILALVLPAVVCSDEEESDMQVAWECLETARNLLEAGECPPALCHI